MVSAEPTLLRTAHASGLNAVGRELAELHRAMLRAGGDESRGVRLSVLTLVAACSHPGGADEAAEVIETIATRHPARAIIVVADRTAPAGIDADLSLRCSAVRGQEQVCAEVVRLVVGGDAALHLTSVITPLLLPDVPVTLWLVGAPPLDQALRPQTWELCERVLLDSSAQPDHADTLRRLTAAVADRPQRVPITDLAWVRCRPWRQQIALAFDRPAAAALLGSLEEIRIDAEGDGPSGTEAALVAGWLRARLGNRMPEHSPTSSSLRRIELRAAAGSVVVEREPGRLVTTVELDGETAAVHTSRFPKRTPAELVGALLEEPGSDPLYAAALRGAVG